MIEDHAAERVIDAVVDVVAELAVADGLADDLGDGRGRRGDQESARLGEDFDLLREQAVDLGLIVLASVLKAGIVSS